MSEGRLQDLIDFQDRVRSAFNWDYIDDFQSAKKMEEVFAVNDPFSVNIWNESSRHHVLERICKDLSNAHKVVIIGAAIKKQDLRGLDLKNVALIAADGAVGVIDDFDSLTCIVSDLDGNPHLDRAARHGQCFIIHAHGDNLIRWIEDLEKWSKLSPPPEVVLSHQINDVLSGMHNFGGFTDGDRAICFALWAGVDIEKIELLGFSTKYVGEWSGTTGVERKMEKLSWMRRVLEYLNLDGQIND